MNRIRILLSRIFFPIKQAIAVLGKRRNSLIARESDVGKELEQAETQPEKKQRIMFQQSMVGYDQQGSSSNTQLTSQLVTQYKNSAVYQRIVILTEKLNHLHAQSDDVLTELENAEIQPGKKRRQVVQHWLTEVQRKEHKIQTMIKDGEGSTSNSKLSLCIESFIEEVDELIQRGNFPKGLVLLDHRSTRYPLLLDKKLVGINFQQNTRKISGWLRNREHCIIGIHGMGGVGKTTLLMHIHDQLLQDSNLFGDVYWVTVSQNCSVRILQDAIARATLGSDLQEHDEMKRAGLLHCRLAERGLTVLILDDMWEHISESKVGIPLGKSNCKIILSTRSYDVCRKMGCKNFVIKAEILHEAEAWDLFVEKLGHYDTLEEEAKKIAWDVAKECGGLPLAIATMARSMAWVVDIYEWRNALNELKSACGQGDIGKDVLQILRYSYDRLKDKRLQTCFLSCILYGEDEKIKKTTLIDLWINEGLFDEIESRDAQVAKGRAILNELERCCLLELALGFHNHECVKMHDLIRDLAIIITKEHDLFKAEARKQLEQVPEEEKWTKDLVKVSLSDNRIEEIPSGMTPMTPKLTVLMLNGNPLKEIPDSFFVHMKALTVLDLSGTQIKMVPNSVSELENLRGLLLVGCYELIYVPSVAKLTNLRTLDLYKCYNLKEAPRGLERLKCVEKVTYIPWDVSDMISFNKVIQSWTSLSLYRFLIRSPTLCESFDEREAFYGYEKVVWIRGGEFGEDNTICLLPASTLECLIIDKCDMKARCLGDVFQSLGESTSVEYIIIKDCKGLESIIGSSGTQQGSTVPEWLPDLRSTAKLEVPHFSQLRDLYISGCPKLKVVLPMTCTNQLHLPNLESMEVRDCQVVEDIFEPNKAILVKPHVVLPKLESLKLGYLPKLKVIFPLAQKLQLPRLRNVKVEKCEELEEIFESNKGTLTVNPILSFPKLENLLLADLLKLGSIYRGRLRCTYLVIPAKLSIYGCPKLKLWRLPEGDLTSDEACSMMEFPPERLLPNELMI